jgi:hypothetical protein
LPTAITAAEQYSHQVSSEIASAKPEKNIFFKLQLYLLMEPRIQQNSTSMRNETVSSPESTPMS